MIVSIGERARSQAERIDAQWREAADSHHLFAAEFSEMLEDLATIEWLGQPWPTAKRPDLKRGLPQTPLPPKGVTRHPRRH